MSSVWGLAVPLLVFYWKAGDSVSSGKGQDSPWGSSLVSVLAKTALCGQERHFLLIVLMA